MHIKNPKKLIACIILTNLAGLIGTIFTTPKISTWYATLIRPAFSPPNWIFAPVWTTLFILMGISLYLILQSTSKHKKTAIRFFSIQLILNALWSYLFFNIESPKSAFMEIILLWLTIYLTIIYTYKTNKKAAYLLIPYLAWVSFATLLNYQIWILNQ